jgi:uncharacterized YceG family protein
MADRSERTAEEREAAWREREARRAGKSVPPPSSSARARPAPQPFGRPSGPPVPWKPVETDRFAEPEPEPEPEPKPEPEPEPPESDAPQDEVVPAPPATVVPPVAPPPRFAPMPGAEPLADRGPEPEPEPEPEPDEWLDDEGELEDEADEYEPPAGTKVVYGAPDAPEAAKRPRRARSIGARVFAVVAIAVVVAVVWAAIEVWQPFHGEPGAPVTVVIPHGSTTGQIGDILASHGVISSSFFFGIRAKLDGDNTLYAGTYHFRRDMTFGNVLKALTTPPPPIPTTQLTLIEGKARSQIDALLRAQGVKGSYLADTRGSPLLDPAAYGAPRGATLEGFLFPSTYDLRDPVRIRTLVADQLAAFKSKFAHVNLAYARSKHLTPYAVLTIASIIEDEAATAHDRPLVASVIYNRLRFQMPLGMDSTTRYAVGNYATPLTASELASPSPYNTRNHGGLPPGPIGNPGLAAIEAAAHPAITSYLYFVVKPCGNGTSVFSSNYNQFLSDSARYQAARSARGGRSPEKC